MTRSTASIVTVSGSILGISYGALSATSYTSLRPPIWLFFTLIFFAACGYLLCFFRGGSDGTPVTHQNVISWGLIFCFLGLVGKPLYEDDFYRYLWDGRQFAETGNPYAHAPADFKGTALPPKFQSILDNVGFPEIPTIYGPTCQAAFALAYWISAGDVWPLKIIWAACSFGIVFLLTRLRIEPKYLLLYLWSPLLFKEIFLTAHADILTAFFSFIALYLADRRKPVAAGASLALAVGAKIPALLILPAIAKMSGWRSVAATAFAAALLYLPFAGSHADTAGLLAFLQGWEFNSFGYALLKSITTQTAAKWIGFGITGALVLAVWRYAPGGLRRFPAHIVWGTFYFFSPVVNPWYLISWLPWNALHPSAWALAASLASLISYATGNNLPNSGLTGYRHPAWVRPLELVIVISAALVAYLVNRPKSADRSLKSDNQP